METFLLFNPDSPLIFTQFYFWAFFGVVYAIFALIGSRPLLRNAFLFLASLFFYYRTSGLSVLLLLFAIAAGATDSRYAQSCARNLVTHGIETTRTPTPSEARTFAASIASATSLPVAMKRTVEESCAPEE